MSWVIRSKYKPDESAATEVRYYLTSPWPDWSQRQSHAFRYETPELARSSLSLVRNHYPGNKTARDARVVRLFKNGLARLDEAGTAKGRTIITGAREPGGNACVPTPVAHVDTETGVRTALHTEKP